MQNLSNDFLMPYMIVMVIGVILLFLGNEVVDETYEFVMNEDTNAFAQKMYRIFQEKRATWHVIWFSLMSLGWALVVAAVYVFSRLLLMSNPNMIAEFTATMAITITIVLLTFWDKIRRIPKITANDNPENTIG